LKSIVRHDYVTHQQSLFIKEMKQKLDDSTAIILMDFSMNYTSVVQDATQNFHWSKKGITVHPLVVYAKDENGDIVHKSLCFLSDDVKHDVTQVRLYQQEAILFIQNNFPNVKEVLYVTDGCAAQYKCCTSFANLCQHESMYGMKASWSFFATSHGKSACDGIGGLVKREAAKESLRRPYRNQILNAQQLFDFCSSSNLSQHVSFFFVPKEKIDKERERETNLNAVSIPGTRSFHHFTPVPGMYQ